MSVRLTTKNGLEMRPFAASDALGLHALWTSAGARRFLWDDEIISFERTVEIIGTSERLFAERRFGLWGVWPRDSPEMAGFGGFWHFREPPVLELLYGVADAHWNRGYATDIAGRVIEYGVDELAMPVIRASTDEANAASVRVLHKLGFSPALRVAIAGRVTLFYELATSATETSGASVS